MKTIKILPAHEAQKVAAGEVVERPASVVKELVENSIDAGASQISVYIEAAGKGLIKIVDNGKGMSREDALLCFHSHATSKISSVDELSSIQTFGFRGEALATISAVSRVELLTNNNDSDAAVRVLCCDGRVGEPSEAAFPRGTSVDVCDLFYNTPARKKFLKHDETEWNNIVTVLDAFCLSHKDISFKLFRDNKRVLNAPVVSDGRARIGQIFDHELADALLEVNTDDVGACAVSGYISNHQFWRYNRNHMFFFVNGRYVKNPDLKKAVLKGYNGVLPPDRFPAAFIFIQLDQAQIDINVHPRKEEVQFSKPRLVTNLITEAIKKALEKNVSLRLGFAPQPVLPEVRASGAGRLDAPVGFGSENFATQDREKSAHAPFPSPQAYQAPLKPSFFENSSQPYATTFTMPLSPAPFHQEHDRQGEVFVQGAWGSARILGQFLNTYIILERGDELVIIDQHAAHERVLYEEFTSCFERRQGTRLMFPEIVTFSESHVAIIERERDLLENLGVEIEIIGPVQVAIKTSPPKVQSSSLAELLRHVIDFAAEHDVADPVVFRKKLSEHVHSHMACKAAVRAGETLNFDEMESLIKKLNASNNRLICAHGRPTLWVLPLKSIQKNFQRC